MKSELISLGLKTAGFGLRFGYRELSSLTALSIRLINNDGPLTKATVTPQTILSGGNRGFIRMRDRLSSCQRKGNLHTLRGALHHRRNPYLVSGRFLQKVDLDLEVDRSTLTCDFGTSTDNPDVSSSAPHNRSEKSSLVVSHDEVQKMFYVKEADPKGESVAKLEYEWVRSGLVDLHHTEVPPVFQGKGVAKALVLAGLDHFCDEDVLIRPTCTYVQKVLRENLTPRYREHVEASYLDLLQS